MPQQFELYMPFPPCTINSEYTASKARNLAWFRSFGLLKTEAAVASYLKWDIDRYTSMYYADAKGELLDIASCNIHFLAILDDQTEVSKGDDVGVVEKLINGLLSTMRPEVAGCHHTTSPLTGAFIKLYERTTYAMSARFCERYQESLEKTLKGLITEARVIADGCILNLEDYMPLRRLTGYMCPLIDGIEKSGNCELPLIVTQAPEVYELRQLTNDLVCIINDIQSLEREEIREEQLNIVKVLQQEHTCPRNEALEKAFDLANSKIRRFEVVTAAIPSLIRSLHLSKQQAYHLNRYVTILQQFIRATYDWGKESARYIPENISTTGNPLFPESYI